MTSAARVLVAEDEESQAAPMLAALRAAGHEVRWARQMREVRSQLASFTPHVILLDTTLDTDGLEFFQAVRFAPEHPPAGIVILTPRGDARTKERAQQLGAAAVIPKPVDGDTVVAVVGDLLSMI
ncbi:MAG: response regulator transcription factor [Candidatus Dormibacteria bacterium]